MTRDLARDTDILPAEREREEREREREREHPYTTPEVTHPLPGRRVYRFECSWWWKKKL